MDGERLFDETQQQVGWSYNLKKTQKGPICLVRKVFP